MKVRAALLTFLLTAIVASPTAAQAQSFGLANFFAGTCNATGQSCNNNNSTPSSEYYTQADGPPDYGITDFTMNTQPDGEPVGNIKDVRVDLPVGLNVNPQAVDQCPYLVFAADPLNCAAGSPGSPLSTQVGTEVLTVCAGPVGTPCPSPTTLTATVYDVTPPPGSPAAFGIALGPEALGELVGGVSWSTDYHIYFTISNISDSPFQVIESRLIFQGNIGNTGNGPLITLPSVCGPPPTTTIAADSYQNPGTWVTSSYTDPVGVDGCNSSVPFAPSLAVTPETTASDNPDGFGIGLSVPQDPSPTDIASSDLKDAVITFPQGMTLNPSAASGLGVCTPAEIGIGTTDPVSCPSDSQVGTVSIQAPGLPPNSLTGALYLGGSGTGPITGPPFTVYLDAESPAYGISVRLVGQEGLDPATGQVTTTFNDGPQLPFSSLQIQLTPGPLAPFANPLSCGPATTVSSLSPYDGLPTSAPSSAFTVDSNGSGGACASPLPFVWNQSSISQNPLAGATSPFSFSLSRQDGEQYLSGINVTLPPGLTGIIPSVPLCGEPQATQGACAAASQIGTVSTLAGAGSKPYSFMGRVYLTGPYNGAPYGLSIVIPTAAGPFDFGNVIVRSAITVNPMTSQVTVAGSLPTIVAGVPIRLRSLVVNVNRPGFMLNPTNCSPLSVVSALTSVFGSLASASSPFQVQDCAALAFAPKFRASTSAKVSRLDGASLTTTVSLPPGDANIASVHVALPTQLPSRLSTLQKACPQSTFASSPSSCPVGSNVGIATAVTPVLPGTLTGPAYLVSHGGEAFPDLDIVLQGDGVEVILVGNTNISKGVTSTTFGTLPDVPVSSFTLTLPEGTHSLLGTNGSLCSGALVMPTTITGQNGRVLTQSTPLAVSGCPAQAKLKVIKVRVKGKGVTLTVRVPAAGSVRVSGPHLKAKSKIVAGAKVVTIKTTLTKMGVGALAHKHHLRLKLRVGFTPKVKGPTSRVFVKVTFRKR